MEKISKLQEFLITNPDDSFLQHALALEYIKIGHDSQAKELFEAILQREPSYVGSYYHLGKLLERNADYLGAIRVYDKGMEECKKVDDKHAWSELNMAREELSDD